MTTPPFLAQMEALADAYAAQQATAATAPLQQQVADLTGQLAQAQATVATDDAAIAQRDSSIVALNAQIAALKAQTPAPPVTPPPVPAGPPLPAGWSKTAFFDDFTGDLGKWNVRHNTWANNELSIVTSRPSNVVLDGNSLALRAQRETYAVGPTTRQYTSGYLDTIGKFSQQYGRWEVRAKLPASKGLWPAFWLRGDTGLGELDIMEAVGGTGKTVQTVHQSTNGGQGKFGHEDAGVPDLTGWHVYAVEREPGVVRWLIDDRVVFTVTSAQATWLDTTFNEPMNIRLNLQVGGSMPSYYGLNVDSTSVLPADFAIDYVRVLSR